MYVIMCETRKHSNPYNFEADKATLLSAYPVDKVETWEESCNWMSCKPSQEVERLNLVSDDEWELGVDRNESHAQIWNKAHTIELLYVSRNLR